MNGMEGSFKPTPEMFQNLIKNKDPGSFVKMMLKMGSDDPNLIADLVKNVSMQKQGGDLLHSAIEAGKEKTFEFLIEKGADVLLPPDSLAEDPEYRNTPLSISAAGAGKFSMLKKVLEHGGSLSDSGAICLSKKRKNVVISNHLGAAAWKGKTDMVKQLLQLSNKTVDLMALEQVDYLSKNQQPFQKEYLGYTPLMLAVASPFSNLETIKALLNAKADFKKTDEFGNSILHIAAINSNNKMIDFITKTLKLDIFGRNKKGDTALSICQDIKNQGGLDILEKYQQSFDKSKDAAGDLLKALEAEEEHEQEAKSKKKDKKWRNKINKIAKAEGISTEEVEKRLKDEADQKKLDEEKAKAEEITREKREAEEAIKKKAQMKKLLEQQKRDEELEIIAEKKRKEYEDRLEREQRKKEQDAKKERFRSAARESKPDNRNTQRNNAAGGESLKKERVKSAVRKTDAPEARQSRHQDAKASEQTPRPKSKSVRRGGEEVVIENKINLEEDRGPRKILGLTGEMALAAASTKAEKAKIRKQMKEDAEKEEQQKARFEQIAKDKADAQKKKLDEERKAQKAVRDAEKQKLDEEKKAQKALKDAEKLKKKENQIVKKET